MGKGPPWVHSRVRGFLGSVGTSCWMACGAPQPGRGARPADGRGGGAGPGAWTCEVPTPGEGGGPGPLAQYGHSANWQPPGGAGREKPRFQQVSAPHPVNHTVSFIRIQQVGGRPGSREAGRWGGALGSTVRARRRAGLEVGAPARARRESHAGQNRGLRAAGAGGAPGGLLDPSTASCVSPLP